MRLLYALISLVSLSITTGFSQLNPELFSQYRELEGTIIYDVLPDRSGNIWIATQGGLVRFDGYEYKRFHPNPDDSTTIGSILTYSLHEDMNGNIWIGSLSMIYVFNPSSRLFKSYNFHPQTDFPEYSQPSISTISEAKNGRIYFGIESNLGFNGSRTLAYYNQDKDSISVVKFPEGINPQNIIQSTVDYDGNIWFIAYNGLYKIDNENKIEYVDLPEGIKHQSDDYMSAIVAGEDGTLWLTSSASKLYALDPDLLTYTMWFIDSGEDEQPLTDYYTDIIFDSKDNLLIGTRSGLVLFDLGNYSFSALQPDPGRNFINAWIRGLSYDSFGNLWMGTSSKGILKYNEKHMFHSAMHQEDKSFSISAGWVDNIFEFEENEIWFGTSGGSGQAGLNKINLTDGKITSYPFNELLGDFNFARVAGSIKPDKIILVFNNQYAFFNVNTHVIEKGNLPWTPDSMHIFRNFTDSRGNEWYCTIDGVYRIEKEGREITHYHQYIINGDTLAIGEVPGIYESEIRGMWLLGNNGLFLLNTETGIIERHAYDADKGDILVTQDINSFYEDKDGIAWVGIWEGGLNKYNPETGEVKVWDINSGLPSMSIQGILYDEENNALWLSTFQGISRFDIQTDQFNNYSLDDGMQGLLYSDGSYLKSADGYMVFGGSNGITYFHTKELSAKSIPPLVSITDFKIGNHSVLDEAGSDMDHTEEIRLSYDQNSISINYTGIHYDKPEKNAFKYKLEHYDDNWREVGNMRSAFYYNLPPGDYTFKLKASNSKGVWNKEDLSLNFSILPPWWKTWWAYGAYVLLAIIAFILVDRIQRRRLIEKQKKVAREKELAQAKEIEKAYHKLKKTQDQLVHSEKMASLGELTAGIAHEIQNPLNFVNNFSEVNTELLAELKEEIRGGKTEDINAIIDDITGNEEKIGFHGKRADGIVKGMLQHSRAGTGEKELTDINELADEYLRLSYHGLRAKDKSFNADFTLEADKSLKKLMVVRQDIGRVLLNLINNAFHAVSERKRANADFKPKVVVSTALKNGIVEIIVKDNGEGIPANVLDKIFQPFFSTKPTGEGTGLGLSMSYEIITKGHGGELLVETTEGEGTEFIIRLKK